MRVTSHKNVSTRKMEPRTNLPLEQYGTMILFASRLNQIMGVRACEPAHRGRATARVRAARYFGYTMATVGAELLSNAARRSRRETRRLRRSDTLRHVDVRAPGSRRAICDSRRDNPIERPRWR